MKKIPSDILIHILSYSPEFIQNPAIFNKALLKKSKVYRMPILGYDKLTKEEYKHQSFIFGNKEYNERYRLILERNFFTYCLYCGVNMNKSPFKDIIQKRIHYYEKEVEQLHKDRDKIMDKLKNEWYKEKYKRRVKEIDEWMKKSKEERKKIIDDKMKYDPELAQITKECYEELEEEANTGTINVMIYDYEYDEPFIKDVVNLKDLLCFYENFQMNLTSENAKYIINVHSSRYEDDITSSYVSHNSKITIPSVICFYMRLFRLGNEKVKKMFKDYEYCCYEGMSFFLDYKLEKVIYKEGLPKHFFNKINKLREELKEIVGEPKFI